jgi:hypothetical protein
MASFSQKKNTMYDASTNFSLVGALTGQKCEFHQYFHALSFTYCQTQGQAKAIAKHTISTGMTESDFFTDSDSDSESS